MDRNQHFQIGASPEPFVVQGAQDYQKRNGIHLPDPAHGYGHVIMPEHAWKAVGNAYDALPDFDKKAVPAFHAMRDETERQFDHMTKPRSKGGMGIDVEVTKGDPYGIGGGDNIWKAIGQVRDDVNNNSRIKVMSTATTGGHPILTNDQNDMFRAVHDVFGHLGSGRGVDKHGEEAAYQKHSRMFSPLARQAMATETRGQNSALHVNGDFQDQKVALLPPHLQSLQFTQKASPAERKFAVGEARERNQWQGL